MSLPFELPTQLPISSDSEFLKYIPGNVLKGHARKHTKLLFFRFSSVSHLNRRLLPEAASIITWAHDQTLHSNLFRKTKQKHLPFFGFGLTISGLKACQFADGEFPVHKPSNRDQGRFVFRESMKDKLFDSDDEVSQPFSAGGEEDSCRSTYSKDRHGVWILANDNEDMLKGMEVTVLSLLLRHNAKITGCETGFRWLDAKGNDREPFGFRDGISGARFLNSKKPNGKKDTSIQVEEVRFNLDQVLIDDDDEGLHTGGSFLVLRKLEQNVEAFRRFEADLSKALKKLPKEPLLKDAGALVVGRERNGVPLAEIRKKEDSISINEEERKLNAFSFPPKDASRCPFHAHIRKVYPRDCTGTLELDDGGRAAQFVRRSVVFDDSPKGRQLPDVAEPYYKEGGKISKDVGLLFMGYMSNIDQQFKAIQRTWMGNPNFPVFGTGQVDLFDSSKGKAGDSRQKFWRWTGASNQKVEVPWPDKLLVRSRGGDFFYVPSRRWLELQSD